MAELDQNYEVEQAHEQEYDPEQEVVLEHENAVEHAHGNEVELVHGNEVLGHGNVELAHVNEVELAHVNEVELAHEIEVEHAPEIEVEHVNEEVEHVYEDEVKHVHEDEVGHANENEPEDVIPEDSHPDVKQNHADEPVSGGIDKWPGWPGESIFRMLVPAQKVGSIIGRKGEYIKKTCEETKARIKILDGPPGTRERAVMVSAKEEPDSPLPPAVDGLLRVLRRVVDGLENDSSEPPSGSGGKVSTRLLVPAPQAGSLIGKQGATVKSIQEESNCIVRVLGSEDLPVFALQDDRVVEVVGEPAATQKAIGLIASHLRKFLVDRSIISLIEMQMQTPNSQMDHMPPPQHWGPPPQHPHGGPAYGSSPHFMPPQQFDNYYPPADMGRPIEKPTHQGISAYGREAPVPMHSSAGQAAPSVITQLTQQMQIPLTYADAVIGTQGASISYIRRVSGATVAIQETRGLPGEMTVEISGTASQVQTAQQLIQNFMAEAAGAAQTQQQQQQQQQAPSADYNAYGSYASNPASNPPSQSGGYGPVYGNSYGY